MSTQLQQARESLAKGDQALAQALAAAVLQEEPQNGEAWFLLSEATDGERKAIFLKKAGKLAPANEEIQARLYELTAPSPSPVVAPEPAPEPLPVAVEADPWDDFDMSALADDDSDGEPIDTSAIMVDDPPAPRPAVQEKAEKPTAVDEVVAKARAVTVPPYAPPAPKPTQESQSGLDWNYVGMIGSAVLAIVLLLLAVWLAVS